MNILLWVIQVLLALHTAVGALWKLSNSEQIVASLNAIPHGVWLAMSVFEVLCSLGLVVPAFNKRLAILAPAAAACIGAEMLVFSGLDVFSGAPNYGHVTYWLVVAVVSVFVAYGRYVRLPRRQAALNI